MPHVIVKLWPGKSEQQKKSLADKITKAEKRNGCLYAEMFAACIRSLLDIEVKA